MITNTWAPCSNFIVSLTIYKLKNKSFGLTDRTDRQLDLIGVWVFFPFHPLVTCGKAGKLLVHASGTVGQDAEEDGRAEGQETGNTACIQFLVK